MWHFQYESPSGQRILEGRRNFIGVTNNIGMWFVFAVNRWQMKTDGYSASTHDARCRGFRAFRRYLRRHPELRGAEVTLVSRFRGNNITAIWSNDLQASGASQ